jgi:hypothetical protein
MIKESIIITFFHATMSLMTEKLPSRHSVNLQRNFVRSWHGHPWANAWFCPWQKRDFHQRSAPSLSSRRTLIQVLLHSFFHKNKTFLTSLTSWKTSVVTSVALLHTCIHSPWDYAQIPDNLLVFVDYLF